MENPEYLENARKGLCPIYGAFDGDTILGVSVEELLQAKAVPVPASSNAQKIVNLVLKAVPLAMGIAVVVTSVLGKLEMISGFTMLGVGLACVGAYLMKEKD